VWVLVSIDVLTERIEVLQFLYVSLVLGLSFAYGFVGVLGANLQSVLDLLCTWRIVEHVVTIAGDWIRRPQRQSLQHRVGWYTEEEHPVVNENKSFTTGVNVTNKQLIINDTLVYHPRIIF